MLKILNVLVLTAIFFSTLSFTVLAQDVEVIKTAPSQINFGDNLTVTITVVNKLNQQITADIKESIGDAQTIEPQLTTPHLKPGTIAARSPYLQWDLTIEANSQKDVSYTIKPNVVGYYMFSPTVVTIADGSIFYSNTPSTLVECNKNGVCEESYSEDYTNCPEDCHVPNQNGGMTMPLDTVQIMVVIIGALIVVAGIIFFVKRRGHKK